MSRGGVGTGEEVKGDVRPKREKRCSWRSVTLFGTVVHRTSQIIQVSRPSGVHGIQTRMSKGENWFWGTGVSRGVSSTSFL